MRFKFSNQSRIILILMVIVIFLEFWLMNKVPSGFINIFMIISAIVAIILSVTCYISITNDIDNFHDKKSAKQFLNHQ